LAKSISVNILFTLAAYSGKQENEFWFFSLDLFDPVSCLPVQLAAGQQWPADLFWKKQESKYFSLLHFVAFQP
jgi:hypothetical protein